MFYGRAAEDVSTWISKVSDFFYLTRATDCQQVAYVATLLQEAAANWWVTLLRKNYGERPADFQELAVRLEKRFGSSTRVDRARAALRDIRQGQSENVWTYSTRFEGLLGKLPSWDQDWARTQFIWGLHSRVAELVTISSPTDLAQAIRKPRKWRWPEILPQEARRCRRLRIHFEAEEDSSEGEAVSMQCKVVQEPMYRSMHLKCKLNRWLPRMDNRHPVVKSNMPNAIIAAGMVISIGSVLLHHDPRNEEADKIVVAGIQEDVEEIAEEDVGVVEEDHHSQLEPLWSRRNQMQLAKKYKHSQVHPQCLVLILRDLDRETS